jgi:lipopolysaccharide biosynthesis regulator YciM
MMKNKDLIEAKKNLNRFLKEHPSMEEYQEVIDRALDGIESPEERLLILTKMIAENSCRFIDVLKDIIVE